MRPRANLLVLLPLLLTLVACPPAEAPDTTEADIAAITKIVDDFIAMNNAGDVDGLTAMFVADPVRMPAGAPILSGIDSVRESLGSFAGSTELTANAEDIQVSGDLGVARGAYALAATPEGGEPMYEEGKWMFAARRQDDGSWKMVCDIWNTNTGMAPPIGSATGGTE